MSALDQQFQSFLRERIYLHNVTPKTAEWYRNVWRVFLRWWGTLPIEQRDRPVLSRADLQEFVVHLRERGVKPVSCNCYLRGINAFCRWLHQQGHSPQSVRLPPQRVEKRLLALHDERALRLILSYRPRTFVQWRVHAVACTALDCGCRIDELLTARVCDFDFDNLLLIVVGKGRKQRKVPISIELRKLLFRFGQFKQRGSVTSDLMFPARDGGKWEHRNARRSFYCFLRGLNLPKSGFHLLRHTFATQYLRNGGDVVRLSIILGHSEVSTTMKYLHLLTEDLQRPHQGLSILNRLR
jgi:integrase/recombinase XerD